MSATAEVVNLESRRKAKPSDKLARITEALDMKIRRQDRDRRDIGRLLSQARVMLQDEQWTVWLEKRCSEEYGFSSRTAYRYMEEHQSNLTACQIQGSKKKGRPKGSKNAAADKAPSAAGQEAGGGCQTGPAASVSGPPTTSATNSGEGSPPGQGGSVSPHAPKAAESPASSSNTETANAGPPQAGQAAAPASNTQETATALSPLELAIASTPIEELVATLVEFIGEPGLKVLAGHLGYRAVSLHNDNENTLRDRIKQLEDENRKLQEAYEKLDKLVKEPVKPAAPAVPATKQLEPKQIVAHILAIPPAAQRQVFHDCAVAAKSQDPRPQCDVRIFWIQQVYGRLDQERKAACRSLLRFEEADAKPSPDKVIVEPSEGPPEDYRRRAGYGELLKPDSHRRSSPKPSGHFNGGFE